MYYSLVLQYREKGVYSNLGLLLQAKAMMIMIIPSGDEKVDFVLFRVPGSHLDWK